ncbi:MULTISPECIES: phosphopantetheine-binding protein [unclassified Streptomyces]|uniref:acyl carrier protein n=1 Tax=unclassified Streptomyces TaxID=2593676 RepID=UPI0033DE5B76
MDMHQEVVSVMEGIGFQKEELAPDKRLAKDLGIDSTELVEIVVALEEHFHISIDADAEEGFTTVADLVGRVDRLLSAGAHPRKD